MYSYSTGGDSWEMVPAMVVFLSEVEQCVTDGLLDVTNLGQLGDVRHQAEPTSRHNPALAPNGKWYVCAADFGGKDYAKLAYFHQALYKAHDPRVYDHGFSQRGDGHGLSWPDGGWHWTGSDQGHCHFDVTMANASLGSSWWVDSLSSTAPWGLANWLKTGTLSSSSTSAIEDDMFETNDRSMLAFLRDRINGVTPTEWYVVKNGVAVPATKTTPGAKPNKLLTTLDGNSLVQRINALDDKLDKVLAALAAK